MARPERRCGPAGGITLGGIIVIVGIVLMFVWSFWIGLIIALGLVFFLPTMDTSVTPPDTPRSPQTA
jgi:hypothetical protein